MEDDNGDYQTIPFPNLLDDDNHSHYTLHNKLQISGQWNSLRFQQLDDLQNQLFVVMMVRSLDAGFIFGLDFKSPEVVEYQDLADEKIGGMFKKTNVRCKMSS